MVRNPSAPLIFLIPYLCLCDAIASYEGGRSELSSFLFQSQCGVVFFDNTDISLIMPALKVFVDEDPAPFIFMLTSLSLDLLYF